MGTTDCNPRAEDAVEVDSLVTRLVDTVSMAVLVVGLIIWYDELVIAMVGIIPITGLPIGVIIILTDSVGIKVVHLRNI